MHECPDCGQACACDQEDPWLDCEHQCEPGDADDSDVLDEDDDEEGLDLGGEEE